MNSFFTGYKNRWVHKNIDEDVAVILAEKLGFSLTMAKLLILRGIDSYEKACAFINPDINKLYDPFLMKDMDVAVKRIISAIENNEKIVVYGDYDVDGVISISVIKSFFKEIGIKCDHYIPERLSEGYGISDIGIDRILNNDYTLIITVDCGITAFNQMLYLENKASDMGKKVDVIITDHHLCMESDGISIPKACAVINPHRPECQYPFKELCGAGVVFKLIQALCYVLNLDKLFLEYLGMVAIATIADVVELKDENRIIVKHGLEQIKNSRNMGIIALLRVSGFLNKKLDTFSIGFGIGPRINAAGRMGDASVGVELLTSNDQKLVDELVELMEEQNRVRQETQSRIYNQAIEIIENNHLNKDSKVIVVGAEGWHHGVIGIVASKLVDRYYMPCFVLAYEAEHAIGSGRSIEGVDIFKAMQACGDIYKKYGGHEQAGGLTLSKKNIEVFSSCINKHIIDNTSEEIFQPLIKVDINLNPFNENVESVEQLELLGPFGQGNEKPVFSLLNLRVINIITVGNGKHLKLRLEAETGFVEAIGFGMGDLAKYLSVNDIVDIAASLSINEWQSRKSVQLTINDLRLTKDEMEKNNTFYNFSQIKDIDKLIDKIYNINNILIHRSELSLNRKVMIVVYRTISQATKKVYIVDEIFTLCKKLSKEYKINLNYFLYTKALEVLHELGIITYENHGVRISVSKSDVVMKVDLEKSIIFSTLSQNSGPKYDELG